MGDTTNAQLVVVEGQYLKLATIRRVVCTKSGWPLEFIKGRPLTNVIRLLLHGRRIRRCAGTLNVPLGGTQG